MSELMSWKKEKLYVGNFDGVDLSVSNLSIGEGSRVVIVAHIHGDEFLSHALLGELTSKIKKQEINKKLEILSIANPLAVLAGSRKSFTDDGDINRKCTETKFTHSKKIRNWLLKYLYGASLVVQVHTFNSIGGVIGINYSGFPEKFRKKRENIFREIGLEIVWEVDSSSSYGRFFKETTDFDLFNNGILNISIELSNQISKDCMKYIVNSSQMLANYINCEKKSKREKSKTIKKRIDYTAEKDGVYIPIKIPIGKIKKGDSLGVLYSYEDQRKKIIITSKDEGVLFYQYPQSKVKEGEIICAIGI